MKRNLFLMIAGAFSAVAFCSCATEPEKKVAGPPSENSSIPWNSPVAGQGQGQFSMMPQNQYRR